MLHHQIHCIDLQQEASLLMHVQYLLRLGLHSDYLRAIALAPRQFCPYLLFKFKPRPCLHTFIP
jgi:hypothetical protein